MGHVLVFAQSRYLQAEFIEILVLTSFHWTGEANTFSDISLHLTICSKNKTSSNNESPRFYGQVNWLNMLFIFISYLLHWFECTQNMILNFILCLFYNTFPSFDTSICRPSSLWFGCKKFWIAFYLFNLKSCWRMQIENFLKTISSLS